MPVLRLPILALAALALAAPASAQDADATEIEPTSVLVIEDVPTYSAGMGRTDGPFTLISLDGAVVVAPDAAARADSASGAWDIGIRGTEVILNGGTSGPGGRRGRLLPTALGPNATVTGPLGTMPMDGDGECPRGEPRVVCHGSGNGWYAYAGNGVEPLDRTLLVERPDGTTFAVRFVRYVLGDALPSGVRPRYVTLEASPVTVVDAPAIPPVEQR